MILWKHFPKRALLTLGVWLALAGMNPPAQSDDQVTSSASDLGQPTELRAFHRQGQTFLTWKEVVTPFSADTGYPDYTKALSRYAHLKYRIYRHSAPLHSGNLAEARLIAELGIGTAFNIHLYGSPETQTGRLKRFVIEEGKAGWGTGYELSQQSGLHVYTVSPGDH